MKGKTHCNRKLNENCAYTLSHPSAAKPPLVCGQLDDVVHAFEVACCKSHVDVSQLDDVVHALEVAGRNSHVVVSLGGFFC